MELELATLEDIMDELGKRSAYGNFIFVAGNDIIIGEEYKPDEILRVANNLATIAHAEHNGMVDFDGDE